MLSFRDTIAKMIIRTEDAISHLMKFLYRTAQNAIAATFRRSSAWTTRSLYATRFIRFGVDSNVMAGRAGDYDAATERFTNVGFTCRVPQKTTSPRSSRKKPRSDLSVLPEQLRPALWFLKPSCRNGLIMQIKFRSHHPVRCCIRGIYLRKKTFRIPSMSAEGAKNMCHRNVQLSKNAGFTSVCVLDSPLSRKDIKSGDVTLHSLRARRHEP